uniref:Uncharacterized protein n=1 Tax=Panagrolaimus davidi TaxID=227884 RepID=A0A914NXS9_9BILA
MMSSHVGIFVMIIVLALNNINACIPTRNIDETSIIPLTTTPLPTRPPPCTTCPTPVQVEDDVCKQLTITPCDENNRLIYDCGPGCFLSTQNDPTDAFIPRENPVDVICDSSGSYFIGTPADQIRTVKCD